MSKFCCQFIGIAGLLALCVAGCVRAQEPVAMATQQVTASVALDDFETGSYEVALGDGDRPATVSLSMDDKVFQSGQRALRLDYAFAPGAQPFFLKDLTIDPARRPADSWGLELWVKMDRPEPVRVVLRVTDAQGEPWETALPLPAGDHLKQWTPVRLAYDWLRLVSWSRVDGRLDRGGLETISLRFENEHSRREAAGTVWIDNLRFLLRDQHVEAVAEGDFELLELAGVYNSDGVSFRTNPLDGDFHTGQWEPRTLPGESFPGHQVVRYQDIPFLMPDVADGRNNHIRSNSQKLEGMGLDHYSAAYFVVSGKFGSQLGDVTATYEDGTSDRLLLDVSDWTVGPTQGDVLAMSFPCAYKGDQIDPRTPKLYVQSVKLDPARRLASLSLPGNDFLKIFAISLCKRVKPLAVGTLQDRPLEQVYPRYKMAALDELTFDAPVREAGVFGGYLMRRQDHYNLDEPTFNGYLTFTADAHSLSGDVPAHELIWPGLLNRPRPFLLGALRPAGKLISRVDTDLLDGTCIQYTAQVQEEGGQPYALRIVHSRTSPAVMYEIGADHFAWYDGGEGGTAYVSSPAKRGVTSTQAADGQTWEAPAQPWLLVWHAGNEGGRTLDVPMLLVFENKPAKITAQRRGPGTQLAFEYPGAAGRVLAMPLLGITQVSLEQTEAWARDGLPEEIAQAAQRWAERLQAYPVGVDQTYAIDNEKQTVKVTTALRYENLVSQWEGIEPQPLAPLPPVALLAHANGYPVQIDPKAQPAGCDTFWGPLWMAPGTVTEYELPLSRYTRHMLVPAQIEGDGQAQAVQRKMASLISQQMPEDPLTARLVSDTCGDLAGLRVLSSSRLVMGPDPRLEQYCRRVAWDALLDQNIKVEKEPLSGQFFLMDDRFWAKDDTYDKEWAIGYMLQGFWSYAFYSGDRAFLEKNWNRIKGLYQYYRIVFDWATGSTWTIVTGRGANSDGIRIAWEGMLAMGRMAREMGDQALLEDVQMRTAKQMMSLYASWFAPQWAADHNYVTELNQHVDPKDAQLNFAPDNSWVENYTCNVSHMPDFFQVTHAFYVFNLAHLMFFHDTGLDELRLRSWMYESVPAIHPQWADGNAFCKGSGRYYGNDHAMAHLIVRALLFREDPAQLMDTFSQSTHGTRVVKEWYTPMNLAPAVMMAIATSRAPLVMVPTDLFGVNANRYDARGAVQTVELMGKREGESELVVRCWGQPVKAVTVNGQPVKGRYDKASDYLSVPLTSQAGEALTVRIEYEQTAQTGQ